MAKKAKDKAKKTKAKTAKASVRMAGDAAMKIVEHPAISSIVAAGLLAAAAALTDNKKLRDAAKAIEGEAEQAVETVNRAKVAAKAAASAIGQAILKEIKTAASGSAAKR